MREVVDTDACTLFDLLADPVVAEYVSEPPPSVQAFSGFIRWAQRSRERGECVCFAIVPHQLHTAVGIIQVRALEPTFFTAEWGFAVGASFWSTGVFTDAANLVAEFAFSTLGVNRLEARAVIRNARAIAALQKLGARPEAALLRSFRKGGRRDPQQMWTLREDDWRERPLVARRMSAVEANDNIVRAVQQMRERTIAAPRPPNAAAPSSCEYPFFITSTPRDDQTG